MARTNPATAASWHAVCTTERQRARLHLGVVQPPAVPLPPWPLPPELEAAQRRGSSVSAFELLLNRTHLRAHVLPRLREALHSRGTLCSESAPCTVDAKRRGEFSICLPAARPKESPGTLCEITPEERSAGFVLRKACSRGARRRCFRFHAEHILRWALERRRRAGLLRARDASAGVPLCKGRCGPIPAAMRRRDLKRCAVVMPGHSLRCGLRPWGRVIDSPRYDAVFRSNRYPKETAVAEARRAGRRTDYAYNHCDQAPPTAFCMGPCESFLPLTSPNGTRFGQVCTDLSRKSVHLSGLRVSTHLIGRRCKASKFCTTFKASGLGYAHSGGWVLDHASALCDQVDVFGMGMFSHGGASSDVIYQHHYDARFAERCSPARCLREGDPKFLPHLEALCRPKETCDRSKTTKTEAWSSASDAGAVLKSEDQEDFFFRSELRLHVLHAIGLINWVWY